MQPRPQAGKHLHRSLLLCLTLTGLGIGDALAARPPLSSTPLAYDLQEEAPATFLERFFEAEGLPVVLSGSVRGMTGTLSGPRSGTPAEILSSIAESNQLVVYYDGTMTHVFRASELDSRYLPVPRSQIPAFRRLVQDSGLPDAWNNVDINAETGLVMASGTPRFLQQMQQLSGTLAAREETPRETTFRYFPLKYAWAGDTSFTVGNRQVAVPGVASLLQQLLYGPTTGIASGAGSTLVRPSAPRLGGSGLAALGNELDVDPRSSAGRYLADGARSYAEPVQGIQAYAPADPNQPRIVADPYRNAVIVRDVPERMSVYAELIETLDIPAEVVEIEATIFDVNTGRMQELGIDWRYENARNEVLFGPKPDLSGAQNLDDIDALPQAFPGFQIGAIIGDGAEFVARINALESDDLTEVTAQPRVVTLNDVEAVIESSRSVYVPVEGAFEVDLFDVFAGTILRVTPHIVRDADGTHIRMLVTVEDGDVQVTTTTTGDAISNVPVVTRNAVNTQAIITAGQSLLLGGLDRDVATRSVTKVPILGDIPVLGRLFRNDGTSKSRSERMFLITPRLVVQRPLSAADAPRSAPSPRSAPDDRPVAQALDFPQDDAPPAEPGLPTRRGPRALTRPRRRRRRPLPPTAVKENR